MKTVLKRLIELTLTLTIQINLSAQTVITENFESYSGTNGSATLPSGVWTFYSAGTATGYSGNGVKLNSSTSTPGYIITPAISTVATISFYAKAGSAGKTMTIQTTTNGTDFTTIATPILTSSFAQYTVTINDTSKNIRIKIMNTPGSGTSEYVDDVVITTLSQTTIYTSVASLPNFGNTIAGNISSSFNYSISGVYLESDVVVTAPSGFEVSKDNSSFSNSLTFSPIESVLESVTVYVRFAPSSAIGTIQGNIVHSSNGATTRNVAVTGTAIATEPTSQPTLSISDIIGNSVKISITGGNGNGKLVVGRANSIVTYVPNDGMQISGINSNFSQAIDKGDGNKILFSGNDANITITGLTPGLKYYFSVFGYNKGTNNSENYLTEFPAIDSATTLTLPGITVVPTSISFGNVVLNSSSTKSYYVSGVYLSPETGNIILTAPTGYELSLSNNSGFASSLEIPYSYSTLSSTQVYVRFTPTSAQDFNGNIEHTGGNATLQNVAVSGTGVAELVIENQPVGFASVAGGVTGGQGGRTVIVTNASELQTALNSTEALIVWISGTINISGMITLRSNKTILGMGTDARVVGGGFEMNRYSNVIIRNITFENSPDDCMKINQNSHHIWVDHCTFLDGPVYDPNSSHDGLFDITRQSDYITISWCLFYNHSKTMLIGHSDSESADADYLRTTIHHNWFKGTAQRHPRVRFGRVHVFNNYYDANTLYGVASACNARVVVEGSYFKDVPYPIHAGYADSPIGYVNESLNKYINCGNPVTIGTTGADFGKVISNPHTWNPANEYTYTLDNADDIPSIVMANAGAGKINLTSIDKMDSNSPTKFELSQNFPNPFNPTTTIRYHILDKSRVVLNIFDLLGRKVKTLVNQEQLPGMYQVSFDASNLPSGVYFYQLTANNNVTSKRMLLMK